MSKRSKPSRSGPLGFWKQPPLQLIESLEEYDELRDAIKNDLSPKGIIERIYVEDLTYLLWEIRRLRRLKSDIMAQGLLESLSFMFPKLSLSQSQVEQLESELEEIKKSHEGALSDYVIQSEFMKKTTQLWEKAGLSLGKMETYGLRFYLTELGTVDRMMSSLEERRDNVLRQIARYRDDLVREMRYRSDQIIDSDIINKAAPRKKTAV